MNNQIRLEKPKRSLDASVVPVERALLSRALSLEDAADRPDKTATATVLSAVAAEFRALAEELHHW